MLNSKIQFPNLSIIIRRLVIRRNYRNNINTKLNSIKKRLKVRSLPIRIQSIHWTTELKTHQKRFLRNVERLQNKNSLIRAQLISSRISGKRSKMTWSKLNLIQSSRKIYLCWPPISCKSTWKPLSKTRKDLPKPRTTIHVTPNFPMRAPPIPVQKPLWSMIQPLSKQRIR